MGYITVLQSSTSNPWSDWERGEGLLKINRVVRGEPSFSMASVERERKTTMSHSEIQEIKYPNSLSNLLPFQLLMAQDKVGKSRKWIWRDKQKIFL